MADASTEYGTRIYDSCRDRYLMSGQSCYLTN